MRYFSIQKGVDAVKIHLVHKLRIGTVKMIMIYLEVNDNQRVIRILDMRSELLCLKMFIKDQNGIPKTG
mgnify:CR=1 FL=1